MCSLYYGTCPWSSASYIPAKWLYEWLMQWQLFPSCEYLCKVCIFLLVGTVSCSFRCLIHSGKQKETHCVNSKRAHLQRCLGKRTVYCPVFNYDFIFDRAVTFIASRLFLGDCSEEGTAHIYIPISGCLQTLCCRPTDLHLICRVKGVWRHLNAYFVNYCKCGFYLWCNVIEYLFILCFFLLFFYITLTELTPALLHLAAYYQQQKNCFGSECASNRFSQLQNASLWIFFLTRMHDTECVRCQRLRIASNAKAVRQTLE